jgi:hypothetical protein
MIVVRTKTGVEFKSTVEEWMADLDFTEVFNFSTVEVSPEEMEITRILDRLLGEALFGIGGIDETVANLNKFQSKPIKGRRARQGELPLSAQEGTVYDGIWKALVQREKYGGALSSYQQRLNVVGKNSPYPDVWMKGRVQIGWDLTTLGEVGKHINRDVYGRAFNRYYLLIWDQPRTTSTRIIKQIERQSRTL